MAPTPRARSRGFTLVEVLVALLILTILGAMAWQGLDALGRTREGVRTRNDAVLRLSTVLAQWEQDMDNLQATDAVPALNFDGASLRLTRRSPEGLRYVVWTRQNNRLWRWSSPPATQVQALQEAWMRAQQWSVIQAQALPMLDDVSELQLYYWRGEDNTWSNAQSSGDSDPQGEDAPPATATVLPRGVRLQLGLPGGTLVRNVALQP